ncbi:MAG TPA: hypothetical protein VLM89_09250 [Phycisphaerae bacterium]|nr:hypothetical protein [Phycisphaerae bacterium]
MGRNPYIQTLIPILPALMLPLGSLISLLVIIRISRHNKGIFAPAKQRRAQAVLFVVWLLLTALLVSPWLLGKTESPWEHLSVYVAITLLFGYAVFRPVTDYDDRQNWVCNPRYCGRCEYDLTGNVSGKCPECGTPIPPSADNIQKPWLGAWWLQWRIDHLDNWRRSLALMVFYTITFAVLTILIAIEGSPFAVIAVVPGLISVSMTINCIRILKYRRIMLPETHLWDRHLPVLVRTRTGPAGQ